MAEPKMVTFEEIRLEKIKIGAQQLLSKTLLESQIELAEDYMTHSLNALALKINGYVWGKELEKKTAMWPDGWVQAIKERFFPTWLRNRFPVRYKIVEIDAKVLYPTIRYLIQNHEPYIRVAKYEHIEYERG